MKKINLSYGSGMSDMLLELGENPQLLSYYDHGDRQYIHEKCGGKQYYRSCSGASGAGYITDFKNLVRVGQYRTDTKYNWFQSPETLRLEEDNNYWSILAPKEPWTCGWYECRAKENEAPIVLINEIDWTGEGQKQFVIYATLEALPAVMTAITNPEGPKENWEWENIEIMLESAGFEKKIFKKTFVDKEIEVHFWKDPEICERTVKRFHPWEFMGHSSKIMDKYIAAMGCANPLHSALWLVEPKDWTGCACERTALGERYFTGKILGTEIAKDGIIPAGWSKPEDYGLPALPNCFVRSTGKNGERMELVVYINNTAKLVKAAADWRCRTKGVKLSEECWDGLTGDVWPASDWARKQNPAMAMILADHGWEWHELDQELRDESFKFAERTARSKFEMMQNFRKIYKELRVIALETLDREVRRALEKFDFEPKKGDEDKNEEGERND